jgi:hypothetical protein
LFIRDRFGVFGLSRASYQLHRCLIKVMLLITMFEAAQHLLWYMLDVVLLLPNVQAQGLVHAMGGRQALVHACTQHRVLLSAHGPYTAAGASDVRARLACDQLLAAYRSRGASP